MQQNGYAPHPPQQPTYYAPPPGMAPPPGAYYYPPQQQQFYGYQPGMPPRKYTEIAQSRNMEAKAYLV